MAVSGWEGIVQELLFRGFPPSIRLNGMRADQQMHLMG